MLVAAIHFRPVHRSPKENTDRLLTLIAEALHQRARLVVAPELALSGFAFATPDEMRPHAVTEKGEFAHNLEAFAYNYDATIIAGVAERDPVTERLCNTAFVADASRAVQSVRAPQYPHNYGWMTGFDNGDAGVFMSTSLGKLRVALCAGLLPLPDSPTPGVIAVPASWNDEPPGSCLPLWQKTARQRRSALVIANRYGREEYSTGADCDFRLAISCIIDHDGRVLACSHEEQHDEILLADLPPPGPDPDGI